MILNGILMGISMVLPGTSWPVMAIILGVYEPLMLTLNKLFSAPKTLTSHDIRLLLFLIIGIGPAIFFTAYFILSLLMKFAFEINAIFIGLILGSVYLLYVEIKKKGFSEFLWFFFGIAVVVVPLLFGFKVSNLKFFATIFGSRMLDFISGLIVSTSLPAIGDTIMLLLLGNYRHLLNAVRTFDFTTLLIFLSGFLIGFFTFVRIIGSLLKNYRSQTYAFIIGLMMASITSIWPFTRHTYNLSRVILFMFLVAGGFLISFYLEKISTKKVKHGNG
jgi:putative membrane protein